MLTLARRRGERIVIAEGIVVTVLEIRGEHVRLGIKAPRSVPVDRAEVRRRKLEEENHAAAARSTKARHAPTAATAAAP